MHAAGRYNRYILSNLKLGQDHARTLHETQEVLRKNTKIIDKALPLASRRRTPTRAEPDRRRETTNISTTETTPHARSSSRPMA